MTVKMEHRTLEDKILLTITAAATLVLFPFLITSFFADDKEHIAVDFVAVGGIFLVFGSLVRLNCLVVYLRFSLRSLF